MVVFLFETKSRRDNVEKVRRKLGFENSFVVDSVGKSGGLAMFWTNEVKAELSTYSRSHISIRIGTKPSSLVWMLFGFYGNPATEKRIESW